jgi:hypothetical protein
MTSNSSSMPAPASLPPIQRPHRRLPLGVAILAVIVGIYGFFLFVFGALSIALQTLPSYFKDLGPGETFGLHGIVYSAIVLIVGLIILGIGVALWRLRLWALVLGLLFLLFEMVSYGAAHQIVSVGFILALLIFVYLIAVNRHFR